MNERERYVKCGFENLCIFMATEEDFVLEMANFWKDFVSSILKLNIQDILQNLLDGFKTQNSYHHLL
jgi:hypothetical protein